MIVESYLDVVHTYHEKIAELDSEIEAVATESVETSCWKRFLVLGRSGWFYRSYVRICVTKCDRFDGGVGLHNTCPTRVFLSVVDEAESDRMARALGETRAALLANHGANVVGHTLRKSVVPTVSFETNAGHQRWTELLGSLSYFVDAEQQPGPLRAFLRIRTVDRVVDYLENGSWSDRNHTRIPSVNRERRQMPRGPRSATG